MADVAVVSELAGLFCTPRSSFFTDENENENGAAPSLLMNAKQRKREAEKRVHEMVYALCEGEASSLVTGRAVWESACFACRKFADLPAHTRDQFVEVLSSNLSVLCAAISARCVRTREGAHAGDARASRWR